MTQPRPRVTLIADGACRNDGTRGPGGWACELTHGERSAVLQGSAPSTTNNRMELLAVIHGLEKLKVASTVHIISDSSYFTRGLLEWHGKWNLETQKNGDLWIRLLNAAAKHELEIQLVKGHSTHAGNNRVDRLAVQAKDDQISPEEDIDLTGQIKPTPDIPLVVRLHNESEASTIASASATSITAASDPTPGTTGDSTGDSTGDTTGDPTGDTAPDHNDPTEESADQSSESTPAPVMPDTQKAAPPQDETSVDTPADAGLPDEPAAEEPAAEDAGDANSAEAAENQTSPSDSAQMPSTEPGDTTESISAAPGEPTPADASTPDSTPTSTVPSSETDHAPPHLQSDQDILTERFTRGLQRVKDALKKNPYVLGNTLMLMDHATQTGEDPQSRVEAMLMNMLAMEQVTFTNENEQPYTELVQNLMNYLKNVPREEYEVSSVALGFNEHEQRKATFTVEGVTLNMVVLRDTAHDDKARSLLGITTGKARLINLLVR